MSWFSSWKGHAHFPVSPQNPRRAHARGIVKARFPCADSKRDGIPAGDRSVDLLLSRRGPRNWLTDVARVGRPGAAMLMLSPISGDPPDWNTELPEPYRQSEKASA